MHRIRTARIWSEKPFSQFFGTLCVYSDKYIWNSYLYWVSHPLHVHVANKQGSLV